MSAKRDSKQKGAVQTALQPQASDRDALKVSGDFSGDALFAAKPSKKPSSGSVGAMKRVSLSPPVPPPPPVIALGVDAGVDDFGLDLDFSRPIEQSLPLSPPSDDDSPSIEMTLEFDDTPSHLQTIDPIGSSGSDAMPDDAFEFADATEVWDSAALDAIAMQGERVSATGLEMELPSGSSIPVPPLPQYPSIAPKIDVAARRAERAERVRALIASREFNDAMDLIELFRASADDGLAEELERECHLAQHPQMQSHKPLPRSLNVALPEPPRPTPDVAMTRPSFAQPPNVPAPARIASHGSVVAPVPPQPSTALPEVEPLDELGGLGAVLTLVANSAAIRTLDLDHRAGFLLSLVDGFSSVEDLLDLANMPSELTLTLLADLKRRGLVQ
jgi:hypothetical protein